MTEKKLYKLIYKISKTSKMDAYVVGGFVRDEILKKDKTLRQAQRKRDVDFVVLGSGLEFARLFDKEIKEEGSLVEFPDFDTARYVLDDYEIEFAGARSEKYDKLSRKPVVSPLGFARDKPATLEEDLSRRDFTVNAMARKVGVGGKLGKVVDPFGGQIDIKNKVLKTPLDPDETFFDDPLRMMRAARFASQLNFSIDKNVLESIEKNSKRLKIISAERIKEELFKLLSTQKPSVGLLILYGTKLLDQFLPEVSDLAGVEEIKGYSHKDNLSHSFAVVDNISEYSDKVLLRFAGLLHDIAKTPTKKFVKGRGWTFDMHEHLGKKMVFDISKRLRLSRDEGKYIGKMVRWHLQPIALMDEGITDSPVRRLVVNLKDDLNDLLILCRGDITTGNQNKKVKRLKNYDKLEKRIAEVLEKDKLREFQSPLRGEEIMELCNLKPSPTVGKIKKEIERAILDGEIHNDYDESKTYFLKIKEDYLKNTEDWEKK
ncbi:MAG: HD domain-containing protein [bacterium]|nr:HD domain-containing protein [bacterium]